MVSMALYKFVVNTEYLIKAVRHRALYLEILPYYYMATGNI